MAYNPNDLVDVETGPYVVQMQSMHGQPDVWRTCYKQNPSNLNETIPATFADVVEAEQFTNRMRDMNQNSNYRVTRTITITEVVHI